MLRGLGIAGFGALAWLDAPPEAAASAAESLLDSLGAVAAGGTLSALGQRMLALPVHSRLARVMIEAEQRGAGASGALIAALLGERPIVKSAGAFLGAGRPQSRDRATVASDILEAAGRFESARREGFSERSLQRLDLDAGAVQAVQKSARQLQRLVRGDAPHLGESAREEALLVSLLAGFPDRVARRRERDNDRGGPSSELLLCGGGAARLSDESGVRDSELLLALDIEERGRAAQKSLLIRTASEVEPEWLIDLFEDRLREVEEVRWSAPRERVEAVSRLTYGKLVLSEGPAQIDEGRAAAVLFEAAREAGIARFTDAAQLDALAVRLDLVRAHFPELSAPALDAATLDRLLAEHCAGRRSFRELDADPFIERLRRDLLGPLAFRLDALFPAHLDLPGGRRVRVHYDKGQPPWIESRLQDFFGERATPTIAQGRLPLVLHLLAPNQRPVQVTSDLGGFWARHYPELRQALSRRYPRHAWPEDPLTARPPAPARRA